MRHSIQQVFLQGWGTSFLISLCFAGCILGGLFIFSQTSGTGSVAECATDDITYTLNLISPAQLGVMEWQVGAYAVYQYRRVQTSVISALEGYFMPDVLKAGLASREVKFHIIGELSSSKQRRYWMRVNRLNFYRAIPIDIYRLVSPADLRITPETPRFDFPKNYVPSRFGLCQQTSIPIATLIKLGKSVLETPAGQFECVQYRVEFGTDSSPIEIWVNPKVSPLGIVRLRTPNEVLELTAHGQDTTFDIPELIQPVIDGVSTLEQGCTSCHGYDNCHEFISPPR